MVKSDRKYEDEIIQILKEHGGKISGFNKLAKLGNFHKGSLSDHLENLEISGKILSFRHRYFSKRTTYLLLEGESGDVISTLFPEFEEIEDKLFSSESKSYQKRLYKKLIQKQIECYFLTRLILLSDYRSSRGDMRPLLELVIDNLLLSIHGWFTRLTIEESESTIFTLKPKKELDKLFEKYERYSLKRNIISDGE